MQNHSEIEQPQERFKELSETLAGQFQALSDAEAKLERRASQMHFRHVEKRLYRMYSLKEPFYPVFVEIISALKSIEKLLYECDLDIDLEPMHEKLSSSIQKYVDMYRGSSADIKSEMHKAFAERADLVKWFETWVDFYEGCDVEWSESEVENANVNVHGFFENSRVLLFSAETDPKKLFQDANKKYELLENNLEQWIGKVNKFNDDIAQDIENSTDKVQMIMEHCENFLQMRFFIAELFKVLSAFEKYLNTLTPGEESDTLKGSINVIIKLIDNLEGNVIYLCKFMRNLAVECKEDNNQELSEFMQNFIEPWHGSKFSDEEALVQSVRVIWEADIEDQLLSPAVQRNSFGK
ncbi:MAG: hypothetical protein SFW07_04670 [Gammaproteobacteria bacterium]|nr:hypothetical protein [Gammaproteobacteria bacterium]